MARWQSDVVLRYVQEAPLECITAEYRAGCAEENLKSITAGLKKQSKEQVVAYPITARC